MQKTPGDRLKERREQLKYRSAASAARQFGWNETTYRSHENGTRGFAECVEDYARAYGVSTDWLLMGVERPHTFTPEIYGLVVRYIPVVTLAEVGAALDGKIMLDGHAHLPVATEQPLGVKPLIVPVSDEAMTNRSGHGASFMKGSQIVVNTELQPLPGEFCLAFVAGEHLPVFRKFTRQSQNIIRLAPLNPDYPAYEISPDKPGNVIGRVMLVISVV